ncbi:hypothetical protein PTI98_002608 [Pleurotus ostreatus]|nr:hypothetical protein PTI98_002608 [Pleurotus ostreatus]
MDAPPGDNAPNRAYTSGSYFPVALVAPGSSWNTPGTVQFWNQPYGPAPHPYLHPTPSTPAQHQLPHMVMSPAAFYTPGQSRKRPTFTWDRDHDENEPLADSPLLPPSKRRNTNPGSPSTASAPLRSTQTPLIAQTSNSSTPAAKRASPRSDKEKLDAALNGIQNAGFEGLGHFFASLFNGKAGYQKQKICQSLHKFLTNHNKPGRRPADIVQAMYDHPYSHIRRHEDQFHDGNSIIPNYAYPVEADIPPKRVASTGTPAQATINSWVAATVLDLVDKETTVLAQDVGLRMPKDWTWESVIATSLQDVQRRMMQLAPLTWSTIATIAVSPNRRRQNHNARLGTDADIEAKKESLSHASHSPWRAFTFAILILLSIRNSLISLGPTIIGLLLFISDAGRVVYHALGRFGISTSYSTVLEHLRDLAHGAGVHLHEVGTSISRNDNHYIILFDNINKHHRAWHQTISKSDEVKSRTASTVIHMVYVPPGAMSLKKLRTRQKKRGHKDLTVRRLLDIDHKHMERIGAATLLRIWTDKIPALSRHCAHVTHLFETALQKHRIPLHQSDIYPLRTSGIDESTTAGNSDVLHDITHLQMGMATDDFGEFVMPIAGDQLTVDRVRKLIHYTKKDVTKYAQHTWVLPFIQLWHMKWAFLKAIYKAHWTPSTGKHLYGLHRDCNTLGRTKLNPTKCDFYPHHQAVADTFETSCLGILRVLLEQKCSKELLDATRRFSLLHVLDTLFAMKM